ncbi:MAG: hypothetical protein ABJA49_01925 [Betaproteobacteria bacterium]
MSDSGNPSKLYNAEPNRDPISGTPGAHPVGTGLGAAMGGALAGAITGTAAGPVGTLVGTALGAIVGGLAGKSVAESIDPTSEVAYWRENFEHRPYAAHAAGFEPYAPAYHYGVTAYGRYPTRSFDEVESELASGWIEARGTSDLEWAMARLAARDAWQRLADRPIPG